MLCSRVQNLLSAYLDSELTGEEMLQIRSHLHRCPDCQREHAALRQVKTLLGAMHGIEPDRPFGPDVYQPVSQPGRLRIFGRVYRVDRWLSHWSAMLRAATRALTAPLSPVAMGGVLGVGILAVAVVRQPQLPDAVSARVPGQIPMEYVSVQQEPALQLVTAPAPDMPAMNGQPYLVPAGHVHVHRPAEYVIVVPGIPAGRYPAMNGNYPVYPTPAPAANLETVGYTQDEGVLRP